MSKIIKCEVFRNGKVVEFDVKLPDKTTILTSENFPNLRWKKHEFKKIVIPEGWYSSI